jgi:hypothetical protein
MGFLSGLWSIITFPFRLVGWIFSFVVIRPGEFVMNQMREERKYVAFKDKFRADKRRMHRKNDEIW